MPIQEPSYAEAFVYDANDFLLCSMPIMDIFTKLPSGAQRIDCGNDIMLHVDAQDNIRWDIPNQEKPSSVIKWDPYFMSLAHMTSQRSKDPNTKVGAVIVDPNRRIVGMGYNGTPNNLQEDHISWSREFGNSNKYWFVVHAELNAILNAKRDLTGCSIYCTMFPCHNCALAIVQSGIKRVLWESNPYADNASFINSILILKKCGLEVEHISA